MSCVLDQLQHGVPTPCRVRPRNTTKANWTRMFLIGNMATCSGSARKRPLGVLRSVAVEKYVESGRRNEDRFHTA
jgi:hypothetical protein